METRFKDHILFLLCAGVSGPVPHRGGDLPDVSTARASQDSGERLTDVHLKSLTDIPQSTPVPMWWMVLILTASFILLYEAASPQVSKSFRVSWCSTGCFTYCLSLKVSKSVENGEFSAFFEVWRYLNSKFQLSQTHVCCSLLKMLSWLHNLYVEKRHTSKLEISLKNFLTTFWSTAVTLTAAVFSFLCKMTAFASLCWYWSHTLRFLPQNSSPAPAPDPKPTMIDDWAVSVKPNADPTIIKKHIEKMVEVSFSVSTRCPFLVLIVTCAARWRDAGRLRVNYLLLSSPTVSWHDNCNWRAFSLRPNGWKPFTIITKAGRNTGKPCR